MEQITISTEEYKTLVEKAAVSETRLKAFSEFVNSTKYSIDREMCGILLGFEVKSDD